MSHCNLLLIRDCRGVMRSSILEFMAIKEEKAIDDLRYRFEQSIILLIIATWKCSYILVIKTFNNLGVGFMTTWETCLAATGNETIVSCC